MRVLSMYPTLVRDGAEGITINIQTLNKALQGQGVVVDQRSPTVRLTQLNSKLIHLTKGLETLPKVWRALSAHDADVVHFHTAIPSQSILGLLARAAALIPSCPLVGHLWNAFVEEEELSRIHSPLEALSHRVLNSSALAATGLQAFQATIVASHYQEEQLRRAGFEGPIYRIPNGVDMQRFRPPSGDERRLERAKLGLPETGLIVAYYGHLTPWKGVLYLVRGFARAAAEVPDATLVIARTGYGAEEPVLRRELRELGIADRAIFLGKVDPPSLLRAADVKVVPAIAVVGTAVFANVLLEALAAGIGLVATRIETTSEVVNDGVNGLLVPPADAEALGAALVRLLKDEGLRLSLGRAARETAEKRFDWHHIASQVTEVFAQETERARVRARHEAR